MRKQKFQSLQESYGRKLKYRELKKDPLIIALHQLAEGAIYFEYVEDSLLPWGAFLVHNLGTVNTLPDGLVEHREVETVFVSFGFHETTEKLVSQIETFLKKLEVVGKLTCLKSVEKSL
jgi:hypothetical protein